MYFIKRNKASYFLLFLLFLLIIYIIKVQNEIKSHLSMDFQKFDNETGVRNLIVPNLIHYVHFDKKSLNFVSLICMLSAHYNHKPSRTFIHTNIQLEGHYFDIYKKVVGDKLKIHKVEKPTHVFGQKLSSVQHSADVARIKLLMKYGGIFLDEDVFVVKNLNRFRHYECAIGWPVSQNIGTQVLVAHRDARFLPLWLAQYQNYRPSMWYYNAGEAPTKNVLAKQESLVHRVAREFGVENLADQLYKKNWTGWVNRYTIHLLDRHKEYLTNTGEFTELNFMDCQCTFSVLANNIVENLLDDGVDLVRETELKSPAKVVDKFESGVVDFINSNSKSLLHKYLSLEVYSRLRLLRTSKYNTKLEDLLLSGISHPDSSLGIYVPEVEAYSVFGALLQPIIRDYHGLKGRIGHPPSDWGQGGEVGSFDSDTDSGRVISTRIRIARSVKGFPLNSKMTREDYVRLEQTVKIALASFTGEMAGSYLSLEEMSPVDHEKLVADHLMFGECDRYLKDAGACQYWPTGRGIFINKGRTFVVWVGEEDHLRIISIQPGGNLGEVFTRLVAAVKVLESKLTFVNSASLGYLTFCPSNLGTTLRASVHLKLPHLSSSDRLQRLAKEKGLQVRGTGGEHTGTVGGVVDISNIKRMGITEVQAVGSMFKGVKDLVRAEHLLEH
eukprot:GFUD01022661.1.p1 GENE.GFUD01022661.1~~GFUD01022661.1.p1  ORF type:complete len:668 (+),score=143.82 GFUD01022661.1:36-2039(+)